MTSIVCVSVFISTEVSVSQCQSTRSVVLGCEAEDTNVDHLPHSSCHFLELSDPLFLYQFTPFPPALQTLQVSFLPLTNYPTPTL